MQKITSFTPPSASSLEQLMKQLGCTNNQMAALSGIKDGNQWRKYTGTSPARTMSVPALFYLAAQLALSPDEFERVLEEMRKIGADVKAEEIFPRNA
ncbi:XRE family transcriptional regulator [Duffyella gerundensis]|uniref:XRE family transcriptional regulator n=1 Tax=Duffyella gerundensis TaxID=1619313 RepID=UPI001654BDE9|nr:XRE family transcriptional regulator [Duffyella gerundensis]